MNDLAPWQDSDTSEFEQKLLHAGRSDHIPDALREQMSRALGLPPLPHATNTAAAKDVAATQHGASGWAWWGGKPAAWTLLSVLAVGALVTARQTQRLTDTRAPTKSAPGAVTDSAKEVPPVAASASLASGVAARSASAQAGDAAPGSEHATADRELVATPPTPQTSDEARARRHAVRPPRADRLNEEIALLDRARSALGHAEPERALAVLASHAHLFSTGLLLPEAEALRIEALLSRGDGASARARLKSFLRAHADSPLAQHLKQLDVEESGSSARDRRSDATAPDLTSVQPPAAERPR